MNRSLVIEPRYRVVLLRILSAMGWLAVTGVSNAANRALITSNVPGYVVDQYADLLLFGLVTPLFAAVGALLGRQWIGLLVGLIASAVLVGCTMLLNYFQVGS